MTKEKFTVRTDGIGWCFVCTEKDCFGSEWAFTFGGATRLGQAHTDKYHRPPVPDPTPYFAVITCRLTGGFNVCCSADDWQANAGTEADCAVLWENHAKEKKH